jgi:class 3 adenylate cyclase
MPLRGPSAGLTEAQNSLLSRRHIPIQPYLTALFAAITLLVGLSTAALFYDRMKAASISDAVVSFKRISAVMAQQVLEARLEIQSELGLAVSRKIARAHSVAESLAAKDDLLPLLNASPLVSEAFVGYPNGDYIRYSRILTNDRLPPYLRGTAAYTVYTVENRGGRKIGTYWFYDEDRKLLAVRNRKTVFDPRTRPWFDASTNAVNVTAPFVFASTFHIGYSVSLRSQSGSVFAADVDLGETPALLRPLLPTPSAVAAAVRAASGVVFALSDNTKIKSLVANRTTPATIYELGWPPLEAAFKAARPPFMETSGSYRDSHGRIWLYTVTPGKGAAGNVLLFHQIQDHKAVYLPRAVLVLIAPQDEIIANATRVRNEALIVCAGLILVMIPIGYWISRLVSRPLNRLRGDALALRNLDFDERPPRSSVIAEVDEFAQTFGTMRVHIREHNEAATHFIPRQFLELLGRRDLRSMRLGDHCESVMTMLFSDIRAFTTLSGLMTPDETFRFVNSYLSEIGPIIREQQGFIDKYIGDAIFALFPDKASNAVDAAIAMQRRVVIYNEGRARAGYNPIAIGIGVHRGDLMLGTIGESLRYETTVLSDAVNIAARMEGLTKAFHSLILVSSAVMADVDRSRYCARRLGDVLLKGATHPVTVYEICDADPAELLAHKMRTKDEFELGRLAYAYGDFSEAERRFRDIAEADSNDHAAAYYRDRSAVLASAAKTQNWDGVEHMESK